LIGLASRFFGQQPSRGGGDRPLAPPVDSPPMLIAFYSAKSLHNIHGFSEHASSKNQRRDGMKNSRSSATVSDGSPIWV